MWLQLKIPKDVKDWFSVSKLINLEKKSYHYSLITQAFKKMCPLVHILKISLRKIIHILMLLNIGNNAMSLLISNIIFLLSFPNKKIFFKLYISEAEEKGL